MADDDLRALVDSLDDASQEDLANVIANFSLDMLQRASALIGAQQPHSGALLVNRTQQCQHQQELEELQAKTAGGKRVSCPWCSFYIYSPLERRVRFTRGTIAHKFPDSPRPSSPPSSLVYV